MAFSVSQSGRFSGFFFGKMLKPEALKSLYRSLGKMFQNASSLKPLGQLKPNCPGMIIGRFSVFYADRKSKMAATTGHSINTGPYRENAEISIHVQFGFNHICSFSEEGI
jgi:hypothetical protein